MATLYTNTIIVNPSEYIGGTISNSSNLNNAYTGIPSTNYATLNINNIGDYAIFKVNTADIPEYATINSLIASIKIGTNNSNVSCCAQLYSLNVPKSEQSQSINSTTNTNTNTPVELTGNFNRQELNNLYIRIICTNKNGSNRYMKFFGANVTIEYQYYIYDIIVDNQVQELKYTSDNYYIDYTNDFNMLIKTDNNFVLYDNDINVTNLVIDDNSVYESDVSNLIPISYDNTNVQTGTTFNNINNAFTNANSTNYFHVSCKGNDITIVDFLFNINDIPEIAVIDSISCSVKVITNTTNENILPIHEVQILSNNIVRGIYITTTGAGPHNLDCGSNWTREDLETLRLRLYAESVSSSNTAYYYYFYGATITVNWHIESNFKYEILNVLEDHIIKLVPAQYIKQNNNFVPAKKIFKKINGEWVQIRNGENPYENDKIYIRK